MRKRRHGGSDIDLTPLLDVLFSVLFLVMMFVAQKGIDAQNNVAQLQDEMNQQSEQSAELQGQSQDELAQIREQLEGLKQFSKQAVFITIRNTIKDGEYRLSILKGTDEKEYDSILLKTDGLKNIEDRLKQAIESATGEMQNADSEEARPIMINFYCNRKQIYTEIFNRIESTLNIITRTRSDIYTRIEYVEQ